RGRVGEPMTFWETRQSSYYAGVYVQGTQALAAIGSPDLVDCALRVYAAVNAHRIARVPDLLRALAAVFPDPGVALVPFGIRAQGAVVALAFEPLDVGRDVVVRGDHLAHLPLVGRGRDLEVGREDGSGQQSHGPLHEGERGFG